MNDPTLHNHPTLALGALPELEPPADTWVAIESRLDAAPARARRRAALAVAAAALLAIGVRFALAPPAASGPGPLAAAVPPANAQLLDQRAADLERLLAALPEQRVARASSGYAATLLEDRIALLDERLGLPDGATLSPEASESLRKQRLVLLDSLVRVKYASAVTASL